MRKTLTIFAVLVVLSWGGTLLADPVTVVFTGVSPGLPASIDIGYDQPTNAGVYNITVNGTAINSYCIDPAPNSNTAQNYWLIDLPSNDYYTAAAWIITTYGFPGPGANQDAANVQMAIWELIPDVTVNSGMNSTVTDMVDEALAAIAGPNGWNATEGFALLVSPDPSLGDHYGEPYQDYIIRTPEPASILLLGLGLFGVGLVGRKYC